jgi:hypothetical protein
MRGGVEPLFEVDCDSIVAAGFEVQNKIADRFVEFDSSHS